MSVRSLRYNELSLRLPKGTSALPIERDAWAFLEAAGITSALQQRAVVQLVRDLKKAQLWTKMKAIYPFVGGTATSHKWNLKDPRDLDAAFRLQFFGGWTHSATGALPNGTNAYSSTHLIVNVNLSVTSHSFGIYSRTENTTGNQVYGTFKATNTSFEQNNVGAGNFISGNLAALTSYTASPSKAFLFCSRRANNDYTVYRNGTSIATSAQVVTAFTGLVFWLGGRNDNGSLGFPTNHEIAFAFLGDGLTDTEAANLYNAVQRYQQLLGRAV